MAYSSLIEYLDCLSTRSILKGSTSSWLGVIGTSFVLILCLAIYIPPTLGYLNGNYFQTQFFTTQKISNTFYSNTDFKLAIVFKDKLTNKVANHTDILQFAFTSFQQQFPQWINNYAQYPQKCKKDYLSNTINPIILQDCFIMPSNALYNLYQRNQYTTSIIFLLSPLKYKQPFKTSTSGLNPIQSQLQQFLNKYYYVVYFTSKIINPSGQPQLQLHSFYSTQNQPVSTLDTSWNDIVLSIQRITMDISIMPWYNNFTQNNLIWLGKYYSYFQVNPTYAGMYGVVLYLYESSFQVISFRYYKKLDWLLGIVGGAMLLFYVMLWIPFHYINKTLHRIRNAEALVLINMGKDDEPLTEMELTGVKISYWFYVRNSLLYWWLPHLKREKEVVKEGERELDVVRLLKKMKIVERTLKRKELMEQFKPKILKVTEDYPEQIELKQKNEERESHAALDSQQESGNAIQDPKVKQIDQFIEEDVDATFGLTSDTLIFLKNNENVPVVMQNNMTAMAIRDNQDMVDRLKESQSKNKWFATYTRKKIHFAMKIFNKICNFIEHFDFFAAKPGFIAQPYNSSLIGFLGTLIIITLSLLTFALTLSNVNSPRFMINQNNLDQNNIKHRFTTGQDFRLTACFSRISQLKGTNRAANFNFFYQNSKYGRQVIPGYPLSNQDAPAQFDMPSSSTPLPLSYCFGIDPNHQIFMGNTQDQAGHFGFTVQPYCSSTPSYCANNSNTIITNFLTFINSTYVYTLIPQNRFDPNNSRLSSKLMPVSMIINNRFLINTTALQQTFFIDTIKVLDDTKNFFMRKQAITTQQGISYNINSNSPISRNIQTLTPYYQVKIRASNNQIQYIIQTPKSDTIIGIIGGVFIFWYAVAHWIGKIYNAFNFRAKLAHVIYEEEGVNDCLGNKLVASCPGPTCILPKCCDIRQDVLRLKMVDKKIVNDLDYLWVVKHVDNMFRLSSALFEKLQEKNLSLVFVKEKLDEAEEVRPKVQTFQQLKQSDFVDYQQNQDPNPDKAAKHLIAQDNSVANDSMNNMRGQPQQTIKEKQQIQFQNQIIQQLHENRIQGHQKPFKFSWLDTFQYPSSLTFKGKREITSCFGGSCCLILLMFILIIANFEVGIYFNRSDTRIDMTTSIMQPLASQSSGTYNSKIQLKTGQNFRLAVTFSTNYHDYPHDVSNFTSTIGISIFQETFFKNNGTVTPITNEIPMISCRSDYLTSWLSPTVDKEYYKFTQFGYCAPDGLSLVIEGLPQDAYTRTFTLSIFSKQGNNNASLTILRNFLQKYLPVYHFSVPYKNFKTRTITYDISTLVFEPFNITRPVQQNLSISKIKIVYDDQIGWNNQIIQQQTYNFDAFRQNQASYYGSLSDYPYYNLTFDNTYLVTTYHLQGDKFYQTFGIIGGIIAFFIFGIGIIPKAYNNYRLKYLIGRQLYLFDILKKKQAKAIARGRKRKTKQTIQQLSDINQLNEAKILWAFLLSYIGGILSNYNFSIILRRVTLIQQRVNNDLSLYQFYKRLHQMRDIINKQLPPTDSLIKWSDIYLKHIYNDHPIENELQGSSKLKNYAKKHNWSGFQQFAVFDAMRSRVNLKKVFDSSFLQKQLNISYQGSEVHMSQFGGTMGSIGTNSVVDQESMPAQEEIQ